MASVSEKLQNLITQIEDVTQDEFETLTEAIQALKDKQLGKEFEIWNANDLIKFAGYVNNGVPEKGIKPMTHLNAKLMANIGDSENLIDWTNLGIGTSEKPYRGIFNGQNFNIWLKFEINSCEEAQEYYGLFHYTENATIKNLTLQGSFIANGDFQQTASKPSYNYTRPTIGLFNVYARKSNFIRCFSKMEVIANGVFLNNTTGNGGIIAIGEGVVIYQCGHEGNIQLTKPISISKSNSSGIFSGIAGWITNYRDKNSRIEECYNKGTIINSHYGGAIINRIDGCEQDDNSIELIIGNKQIFTKNLLNLPDDIDVTENYLNIEVSDNLNFTFDSYTNSRGDKTDFLCLYSDSVEEFDNGFIKIKNKDNIILYEKNVILKNEKNSLKTNIVKNCYSTGIITCIIKYTSNKITTTYNTSAGIFGYLDSLYENSSHFLVLNCYDASIYPLENIDLYLTFFASMALGAKDCHFINCHLLNNTTAPSGLYNIILNKQYSALMEHPHFCDMLDSKVFICADKYPCFKWEHNNLLINDYFNWSSQDFLYLDNIKLPMTQYKPILKKEVYLNSFIQLTDYSVSTYESNKNKKIIFYNKNIMKDAFTYNINPKNINSIDISGYLTVGLLSQNKNNFLDYIVLRNSENLNYFLSLDWWFDCGKPAVYIPYKFLEQAKTLDSFSSIAQSNLLFSIEGTEFDDLINSGVVPDDMVNTILNQKEITLSRTGGFIL